MITNSIWCEKYRPDTLENYIGNDVIKAKLHEYIVQQDIPHLLFHGTAGTGKTTAAKLLTKHIECDCLFINASDERGIDVIRDKIRGFASTAGFKGKKIVVLDEADYITAEAQAALRNLMEAFSATTKFILTCNYIERMIPPIISRTQVFQLMPPSKKEVAQKLAGILKAENVQYESKNIAELVHSYYPDIRKIINTAQLQTQDGILQTSAEQLIAQDIKLRIVDTLSGSGKLVDKIKDIRKIIADNQVQDYIELYQLLYQNVEIYAGEKVPQAIIAIGEGQFRDGQVPDREINFVATLYTILTS